MGSSTWKGYSYRKKRKRAVSTHAIERLRERLSDNPDAAGSLLAERFENLGNWLDWIVDQGHRAGRTEVVIDRGERCTLVAIAPDSSGPALAYALVKDDRHAPGSEVVVTVLSPSMVQTRKARDWKTPGVNQPFAALKDLVPETDANSSRESKALLEDAIARVPISSAGELELQELERDQRDRERKHAASVGVTTETAEDHVNHVAEDAHRCRPRIADLCLDAAERLLEEIPNLERLEIRIVDGKPTVAWTVSEAGTASR